MTFAVQERLLSGVLTRAVGLGVVAQLIVGAESLIAQVDITNSLLCDPARLEHNADRTANRLVGEGGVDTVSVLDTLTDFSSCQ